MALELEFSSGKRKIKLNINKLLKNLFIASVISVLTIILIVGGPKNAFALIFGLGFWILILLLQFYPKSSKTLFGKLFNRFRESKLSWKRIIIVSIIGSLVLVISLIALNAT